ncbi:MAG: RNA 2',3'-cyclic phosphodiesterase [Alicyclobacillus sp.]|nr:RNA 2',3'-cyclic phosphodiesterase [Alicyclobacillus sp.]
MARWFYGVSVPEELQSRLAALQAELRAGGLVARRWSAPELLHVTVLFVGNRPEAEEPVLVAAGKQAVAAGAPFAVSLTSLGRFPRSRVLWAGLTAAAEQGLAALHREVQHALKAAGWAGPLEARPYRAHLTLARELDADSWEAAAAARTSVQRQLAALHWRVQELCLYESLRLDGRLRYVVRHRWPLGEGIRPVD